MNSQLLWQDFAKSCLQSYELANLKVDNEVAIKELAAELADEYKELNSIEVMRARLNHFQITGAVEDDYRERLKTIDDGRIIYGIRHMGGDRNRPFINLTADFGIASSEHAHSIYQLIKEEFEVFSPMYISFHHASEMDVDMIGSVHLVQRVEQILSVKPWPFEDKLKFRRVTDDSYYEWYRQGYEDFHLEQPQLAAKVTVNSHESMSDSLEQGLLQEVDLNGERIGLIVAEDSSFLGHSGLYFHEIFIDKKWKGRGLAKAMQRKFVTDNAGDREFIWGTIDQSNLSSLKTALSNKRLPIRYECFVNTLF